MSGFSFDLKDSPFCNVLKFDMTEVIPYLEPHLRSLVQVSYDERGETIAPGSFLFSRNKGYHFSCYDYPSPSSFVDEMKSNVNSLGIVRSLTFSPVGSLLSSSPSCFLLVDVQCVGNSARAAIDLAVAGSSYYPVDSSWGVLLPPDESSPPPLKEEEMGDPVSDMILNSEAPCTVSGTEMFAALFPAASGYPSSP